MGFKDERMFALQQKIHDILPELESLLARYQQPLAALQVIRLDTQQFKMRVPLVGAFSAGKSTLLNALLGEKLLSVEVDPETSLATELHHDVIETIIGHHATGETQIFTREALLNQQFAALVPDGWVEVHLTTPVLAHYEHLCLVDMPGLDSGMQAHVTAIDRYIGRSLAYCIVISADDGTLHKSTRDFLQELALHQTPVIAVLTKIDKKSADEQRGIVEGIHVELSQLLGNQLVQIACVSARKRNIQPFLDALNQLEQQSEQRFHTTVGRRVLQLLASLDKELDVLINKDDLSSEQLQVQRQELDQEMLYFQQKLEQETDTLQKQLEPILDRILTLVSNRLRAQLDGLASQVLQGGDLNGTIGHTVRMAVIEGVQQELAPKIQRYASRIEAEMPHCIRVETQFTPEAKELYLDSALISGALTTVVANLLKRFPIITALIPVINQLLEWFVDSTQREHLAEQRRESARLHVLDVVIPQVSQQLSGHLRQHLQQQINEAKQQIAAAVDLRGKQHQTALAMLETQLQSGQAAFAQAQEEYLHDQEQIRQWMKEWEVV